MNGEELAKQQEEADGINKYFQKIKAEKQKISDEVLLRTLDNSLLLMDKYKSTGQIDAIKKLANYVKIIKRERLAVAQGVDLFVYRDDIESLEKINSKNVFIIELSRYEREIPDEVIEKFKKVKDVFDEFLVVFTDYSKEKTHKEKTIKERDPILFGVFTDAKKENIISNRMYFIGDWIDDYCDLTIDELVNAIKDNKKSHGDSGDAIFKIRDPESIEDIENKIKFYEREKQAGRAKVPYGIFDASDVVLGPPTVDKRTKKPVKKQEEKVQEKSDDKAHTTKQQNKLGAIIKNIKLKFKK